MAKQCALGLKSDPKAIAIPCLIISLAGGGFSLRMYAVVGRRTPIVPKSQTNQLINNKWLKRNYW